MSVTSFISLQNRYNTSPNGLYSTLPCSWDLDMKTIRIIAASHPQYDTIHPYLEVSPCLSINERES